MPRASEQEQARRIAAELSGIVERAVSSLATVVLDTVASTTPKDTGASASSWVANTRKSGPVVKRTGAGLGAGKARQAASRVKLLSYRLGSGPVHVGSAQPGIRALNAGASRKEPSAFVQRAIAKALTTTRVLTLTTAGRGGGGGRR